MRSRFKILRNLVTTVCIGVVLVACDRIAAKIAANNGPPPTPPKLAAEWRKLAEQGDAEAQYSMGMAYKSGRITDHKGPVPWYRDPAFAGQATAAAWLRKSAEQGYPPAQSSLGTMYTFGSGVPLDRKQAFEWKLKAAEQGYPSGQAGACLEYFGSRGSAVKEDFVQAYMWCILAAEGGYKTDDSIFWLEMHMTPEQIEQGKALAKAWIPQCSKWNASKVKRCSP